MSRNRIQIEEVMKRHNIDVVSAGPPADHGRIQEAERRLAQRLPDELRELYEAFDGIRSAGNTAFLWPLLGGDGMVDYNLFVRREEWSPSWIHEVIFFGHDGYEGYWGLNAKDPSFVVEWEPFNGEKFTNVGASILCVWAERQRQYNTANGSET